MASPERGPDSPASGFVVIGLRALAMHAAFHEEVGQKQQVFGRFTSAGQLDPERLAREARAHRMVARRATPLLKYLAAEKAAFATKTSKKLSPASSRKSVLTPHMTAADSVYSPARVKYPARILRLAGPRCGRAAVRHTGRRG